MSYQHTISSTTLSHNDLKKIMSAETQLSLSKESKEKIARCREYLDKKINGSTEAVYGINTGFGSLYNKNIPKDLMDTRGCRLKR